MPKIPINLITTFNYYVTIPSKFTINSDYEHQWVSVSTVYPERHELVAALFCRRRYF